MAFSYLNAFDLLGDDETDDVNVLCTRLEEKTKKKIADDLPTSPRRTRKQYVVVAPKNSDQLVYEDDISVKGHGASETTDVGSTDANRRGDVAENGTWQCVSKKVKGRGRSEYQRVENGEVKEGESVCDGTNGADVVDQTAANSEGAAGAVIVESSNAEEVGEKEATEEVNGEVAQTPEEIVEETAEERKERERWEKEEERRRIRKEEEAEEAKKMTLAQYEKILSEKKQALKLQRAEVKRVVAADKELESMLLLSKKLEKEEQNAGHVVKPTSEAKLKKSESIEKKGRNPVVAELSKLFKPASFRGSNGGGRGRGIARGGRLGSRDHVNSDRPQRSNEPSSDMIHAAPIESDEEDTPPELRKNQFPALGSVPSEPTAEPSEPTAEPSAPAAEPSAPAAAAAKPSAPNGSSTATEPSAPAAAAAKPSAPNGSSTAPAAAAKPSAPNGSSNGANHSEPSKKHYGSRGNRSGSRPYRGGYAGNRYYSSSAGNRTSAATQSAPAAKSSARTEH